MTATVVVVKINENYPEALRRAIELAGGLGELNTPERSVTIKIGLFDPRSRHHARPEVVKAIIDAFDQAPRVYLAESNNYCGNALDRLALFYQDLYSDRVMPINLSEDPEARVTTIADEEMALSHTMFKPNVFITTHILRTFQMGSVLKNLFGCTPTVQKAKFHKRELFARHQAEIFEATGGFDLAVMDGSALYAMASEHSIPTGVLIVGKDSVAVETIGAVLAGLKLEKVALIQEFARRGLGEGDPANIDVVGITREEFHELKKAPKLLKKLVNAEPKKPGISGTIDRLVEEGWMNTFRCVPEVVEELKARGVENAKEKVVETTLKRRAGRTIEAAKDGKVNVYRRAEQGGHAAN